MRAFIALELPRTSPMTWRPWRGGSAPPDGRFPRPKHYHLTLAFLGDIDDGGESGHGRS